MRLICAALALVLSIPAQQENPDPQAAFATGMLEALTRGDAAVAEAVRASPPRALEMTYRLVRQAANQGWGEWASDSAERIARALAEEGHGAPLENVERYAGYDARAWQLSTRFDATWPGVFESAAAGRFDEAATRGEAAWQLAVDLEDPFLEAEVARTLGLVELDRGRLAAACVQLERALELDRATGAELGLVEDARLLGDAWFRRGAFGPALTHYELAQRSARSLDVLVPVDDAEFGALLAFFGRAREARAHLDRALIDARTAGDGGREAYVLATLGALAADQGRYGDALRLTTGATQAARLAGDVHGEAGAWVRTAAVELELGRSEGGRRNLERALALLDGSPPSLQAAHAELELAVLELDASNAERALVLLDGAERTFAALENEAGSLRTRHQRARAWSSQGLNAEAEAAWRELAAAHAERDAAFDESLACIALGEVLEARSSWGEARSAFERARSRASEVGAPEASWRADHGLGRVLEALGETAAARGAYAQGIATLEALRGGIGAATRRRGYLRDRLELYRRAARLEARAGQVRAGLELAEAGRARTLLEHLARGSERAREAATAALETVGDRSALQSAQRELALVERRRSTALREGLDASVLEGLDRERARVRARLTEARIAEEAAAPRRATLDGGREALDTERLRTLLPVDTALLEYLAGPDELAVWVVRRDSIAFVELPLGVDALEQHVARLAAPIADLRRGATDVANIDFDLRTARALFDGLVRPLEEHLAGCDAVWIVPDGALWNVPFAALLREREPRRIDPSELYATFRGCRFWIEEVELALLPCAALLLTPSHGERTAQGTLVFADPTPLPHGARPLPGAREEAARIAATRSDARLHAGAPASEARFVAEAPGASWIHLAVHGELDHGRPAYSRLALAPSLVAPLAPGTAHDGWLHAFEVARLELSAEHVVLGACETAGRLEGGEGLLGLARAFLVAGTGSVTTSRWVVDDAAAAELMARTYAALGRGVRPAAALREAQLGLLREGRRPGLAYAHPFFWAGYAHIGRP